MCSEGAPATIREFCVERLAVAAVDGAVERLRWTGLAPGASGAAAEDHERRVGGVELRVDEGVEYEVDLLVADRVVVVDLRLRKGEVRDGPLVDVVSGLDRLHWAEVNFLIRPRRDRGRAGVGRSPVDSGYPDRDGAVG